jgi:ribosomal 30S subunit maturation factor RimM
MNGTTTVKNSVEDVFFLTELLGAHAHFSDRKVGKLKDVIALDQGPVAEVTHFQIARPFGEAPLLVPFSKVR